jgi:protein-S-isoprenylcysteine O-methyltransferase Ste14
MTGKRFRIPPALAFVGVTVVYGSVDVAVPIALSALSTRHGWSGVRPGLINLPGVVLVIGGAVLIVIAAVGHTRAWRGLEWRVVKFDPDHLLTPDYLVTDGLYRYTRNPLYVADLAMWAGWAIFLGSIPVTIGLVVMTVGLRLGLQLEERGLARQFGDQWRAYAATTPRFIGIRRLNSVP